MLASAILPAITAVAIFALAFLNSLISDVTTQTAS